MTSLSGITDPYTALACDLPAIRDTAETFGFCLVKSAFTPAQVAALADDLAATHGTFGGAIPDLLSCPRLRWILFDGRLLAIARALLSDELVYYGETSINFERTVGEFALKTYNELHIDARGRRDDLSRIWKGKPGQLFRGYRFGIYLQDYRLASGGLKVLAASHVAPLGYFSEISNQLVEHRIHIAGKEFTLSGPNAPLYNVPSQPGDLVVWNLRTMHAARAQRLASNPHLALTPTAEDQLAATAPDVFLPQGGPRNAIFFDLGTPVEEVDLYIKQRSRLTYQPNSGVETWTCDNPDLQECAARHNILLRFDKLIVALAIQLRLDDASPNAAAPELKAVRVRRLLELARRHAEYSPFHPLFDRQRFSDISSRSSGQAARYVVSSVIDAVTRAKKPLVEPGKNFLQPSR